MKITLVLLLAMCLVLLDTSGQADALFWRPRWPRWPRPWNPCRWVRCRPGYYCAQRGRRGVCVSRPWFPNFPFRPTMFNVDPVDAVYPISNPDPTNNPDPIVFPDIISNPDPVSNPDTQSDDDSS